MSILNWLGVSAGSVFFELRSWEVACQKENRHPRHVSVHTRMYSKLFLVCISGPAGLKARCSNKWLIMKRLKKFLNSSVVERRTVNSMVPGSTPGWGASFFEGGGSWFKRRMKCRKVNWQTLCQKSSYVSWLATFGQASTYFEPEALRLQLFRRRYIHASLAKWFNALISKISMQRFESFMVCTLLRA